MVLLMSIYGLSNVSIGRYHYDWVADYIAENSYSDAVGSGFLKKNSGNRPDLGSSFFSSIMFVMNETNDFWKFCVLAKAMGKLASIYAEGEVPTNTV